jgi:hypothetical protein
VPRTKKPRRPPTSSPDERLVRAIEKIRRQSNTYWMAIVRLALREAREEARAIFRKIEKNDRRQMDLIRKTYGEDG